MRAKHHSILGPPDPGKTESPGDLEPEACGPKEYEVPFHIPLGRFSRDTIDRIRRFHVLNGKRVRSYAARFIRDL